MDLTTDTQKNEYLHKLYFEELKMLGRDNLFEYISKQQGIKTISRRFIASWLAANVTQQLFSQRKKQTNIKPILAAKVGIFKSI